MALTLRLPIDNCQAVVRSQLLTLSSQSRKLTCPAAKPSRYTQELTTGKVSKASEPNAANCCQLSWIHHKRPEANPAYLSLFGSVTCVRKMASFSTVAGLLPHPIADWPAPASMASLSPRVKHGIRRKPECPSVSVT